MHGVEHARSRPKDARLVLAEDGTASVRLPYWGIAEPAGKAPAVQLQRYSFGDQPFEQAYPAGVHVAGDDQIGLRPSWSEGPVPTRIAGLRKVIHRQIEVGAQALNQMRLLEEQRIIGREQHQLPPHV